MQESITFSSLHKVNKKARICNLLGGKFCIFWNSIYTEYKVAAPIRHFLSSCLLIHINTHLFYVFVQITLYCTIILCIVFFIWLYILWFCMLLYVNVFYDEWNKFDYLSISLIAPKTENASLMWTLIITVAMPIYIAPFTLNTRCFRMPSLSLINFYGI